MALIYTINFDSRYAGYEATVTDANGSEVDGSPVTLDSNGDATISLTALGHYRAAVFNTAGPFGDGYSVVDCVLDEPASIAAGGGGGGGFDLTGEGSPVLNEIDPAEHAIGTTYKDAEIGALYMVVDIEGDNVWMMLGGEISAPPDFFGGVTTGRAVVLLGSSTGGLAAGLTDVDGYNGSGNGVYWRTEGSDGGQTLEVRMGQPGDRKTTTWYDDGSVDFPVLLGCEGPIFGAGPVGTAGAEPGAGEVQAGQVYMWFDPTNGDASVNFKGKTADGTVVSATIPLS